MTDANQYLDHLYPSNGTCLQDHEQNPFVEINNYGKKRSEITYLYLVKQELTGSLDLSDFINLE